MRASLLLALSLVAACKKSSPPAPSPSAVAPVGSAAVPATGSAASPAPTPAPSKAAPTSFRVTVTGAGRPVIFMPGLTCDEHVWDATVAHLDGKVEAHVISLAGFAGNPAIDKPLLPTVRDELIAYIKDHHLDRPIFVGHSIGGFMAYWLAETAPDLLGAAVAVDGAPYIGGLFNPAATVAGTTPMAVAMRDQTIARADTFAATSRTSAAGMMREPDKHAAIIESASRSDPKVTAETMYFVMTTDLRPELKLIKVPILAIAADGDGRTPRSTLESNWRAQIDLIPKHELVMVEHSRHFVMFDQPDAYYAALDAFLAKH